MIIGIDLGISSAKVVAMTGTEIFGTEDLRKAVVATAVWEGDFDPKRLEEFIASVLSGSETGLADGSVESIAVTGVGIKNIGPTLLGYPVVRVDEFEANAAAASCLCDEPEFIVVSMGSGTSLVEVTPQGARHIGGCALGGGTIMGSTITWWARADGPN